MALHILIGHYTVKIASSLHGKEALEHQLNSHYSLVDYRLPAISLKYFSDWVLVYIHTSSISFYNVYWSSNPTMKGNIEHQN